MVLNRTHVSWFILTLLATVAIAGLYWLRFYPDTFPFEVELPRLLKDENPSRNTIGGTRVGLLFGTLALFIFLFAAALGARKKKPLWRIGRVEFWLKAHIWLTLLTIPLVGFHSGWEWGSSHTTTLLVFYIIVMASGIFGLVMQQFLPGYMKERLPREVVFEQIPHVRKRLLESAETFLKEVSPSSPEDAAKKDAKAAAVEPTPEDVTSGVMIRRFLEDEAVPYLRLRKGRDHKLGNQRMCDDAFRVLKLNVAPKWFPRVEELQAWCDERRRMDLQTRLQHWLHGWLLIHVPVSLLLLIITFWHAIIALRLFVVKP